MGDAYTDDVDLVGPHPRILEAWFTRAGVRGGPHRAAELKHGLTDGSCSVIAQLSDNRMFFPLELMPHVTHPLMRRLGPEAERMVAARHLFQYLLFTTHFELGVVNRATARIAQGDIGIRLPNAARADALKIYTDEAYHALSSIDLVARLEAVVGIQALPYDFAPYLTRLDEVGRHALPGRLQLAQLLQVVVFETLVTSILTVVPADRTVLDIVRDTVADHAEDERRHHAYFSAFFRELWAGLDRAERAATARCLPQLIRQSLQPDLTPTSKALAAAGMKPSDIRTVLAESYSNDRQVREAAIIARHSVRLFRNCGVLDTPEAVDAFEAAGLLPRESPDSNSLEPAACGNAPGSRP